MPAISRFYGIVIYIYFSDHGVPHFHAKYNDHWAVYSVNSLRLLVGRLPAPQRKLVEAWAVLHQDELIEASSRLSRDLQVKKIPGLR